MAAYDSERTPNGLGCLLVVPTAIFGFGMLTDDIGPRSWRLSAEFIGWCTLCVLVAITVSRLLKGGRMIERIAGVAAALVFLLLAIAEAHPDTPNLVKDLYSASLQVLGAFGLAMLVRFVSKLRRGSYRS